ncbi:heterocyst frequency control protein PatD [Cyanothece sp. BG0011]|uniref:heterocyst frequency control protein PatD n=1 Tax=Cyanothece sp. BG0011 TaxID=2082950 RepID=UPI000D1F5D78|nr:heterocyst frequency control protein PatD [Cyanothece sp. BG0011]
MLLKFYHQFYHELLNKLLELQKQVLAEDIDMITIKSMYQQVQTIFHDQILSMKLDELDCNAHRGLEEGRSLADLFEIASIRSAQTEINKNLRLLGTELLFLTASRQVQTTEKRLEKVQEKVKELIGYSQAIISQLEQ